MRQDWTPKGTVKLTNEQLAELIGPVFPGRKVLESKRIVGGLANTNYCLKLSGFETEIVLRIFERDPASAQKEVAIHKLISDTVPMPHLFHFAQRNEITGHPYSIMEWVEGQRLETLVSESKAEDLSRVGESVGATLAAIHSFPFDRTGLLDARLDVETEISCGGQGLIEYAEQCLHSESARELLGDELASHLIDFIEIESGILDDWQSTPCLVHGDFGVSNILIENSDMAVAAVLDWEFAFSGTPFFDFGNLLRRPLGQVPGFAEAVEFGYRQAGGILPDDWQRMSKLADLTAWLEFLTRPNISGQVVEDARHTIAETISTWEGDLV